MSRFDRNIRLFGREGQEKLRNTCAVIVGVGGLGSHVTQQLSLLGVGKIVLIDDEEISISNKNRYVGAIHTDPVPGSKKVDVGARLIESIDPTISVLTICDSIVSKPAFHAIKKADYVFGCLDDDGARFVLNEISISYSKIYIDLASDVVGEDFGGRVVIKTHANNCLYCLGELDQQAIQLFLESPSDRKNRESVYGVDRTNLGVTGPSVVSVNGVIASLAVTEFMISCTGMGQPKNFINYDGRRARAAQRLSAKQQNCLYCHQWGIEGLSQVDRYLGIECG